MATQPPLKNGFNFKKPDPAYLEQLDRATQDTRKIVSALNERYPGGALQARAERLAR